jgi:hypothetical protein
MLHRLSLMFICLNEVVSKLYVNAYFRDLINWKCTVNYLGPSFKNMAVCSL